MSERVKDECCNVSLNNVDCEASAGYTHAASLLVECFKCGNWACRKCSDVVPYLSRRCRLCADCQDELKLEEGADERPRG